MSSPEHKEKIWNLIKEIGVAMLVTHDDKVGIHARPMQLVQNDYDNKIWFYTNTDDDKVFEIAQDREVCLSFSCPHHETYVSMTGTASLINDQAKIEEYWNPFVDAWFPEGKNSSNIGMIEVKINKGEHWDSESSSMIQAFKMLKASVTDQKPDLDENEKFG